ncbi:MAG: hypothetical protein EXQ79_00175 [Acidimicrobiia bacterium]|nr:hypothetical protein [Acidimicrobiia bacterium]
MEDRITPELYIELSNAAPDEYEADRVPVLLREPGVERVTWWVNDHVPGHPRSRMPEVGLLGVCELAGAGVAPPAPDPTVMGLHFHRYPRPGQGVITGKPTLGLLLVLISAATPAEAQSLRDWADYTHIRHIAAAAVPGYTMITPYERVDADWDGNGPRFMHFYEMDTDAPQRAYEGMLQPVMDRLGGADTPEFTEWAEHPALVIEYVNTFRRVGEAHPPEGVEL